VPSSKSKLYVNAVSWSKEKSVFGPGEVFIKPPVFGCWHITGLSLPLTYIERWEALWKRNAAIVSCYKTKPRVGEEFTIRLHSILALSVSPNTNFSWIISTNFSSHLLSFPARVPFINTLKCIHCEFGPLPPHRGQ